MTLPDLSSVEHALAFLQSGDAEAAHEQLRAILADPAIQADGAATVRAAALHGMACVARAAGRHDAAAGYAGQAIRIMPESHFHITLGLSLLALGHAEPARAALNVAVAGQPRDPRAHLAMAEALAALDRADAARTALDNAIRLRPLDHQYRLVLAQFLSRQGDWTGALSTLRDAVRLSPAGDVAALYQEAVLLERLGRMGEAEAAHRAVLAHRPDDPAALANHGAVLFVLGRLDEALLALERSASLAPAVVETQSNLGLVQMALGALPEAREALLAALHLRPDDPRIALNYGTVLADLGAQDEARAVFRSVMESAAGTPDAMRARLNLAVSLLAEGAFDEAWPCFEARRALLADLPRPDLPDWDGAPCDGPVLLCGEQGLGDFIQFLRFVPLAAERVEVVLVAPDGIRPLMAGSAMFAPLLEAGRLVVIPAVEAGLCVARARASLLSLPLLLGVQAPPVFAPYLCVPGRLALPSAGAQPSGGEPSPAAFPEFRQPLAGLSEASRLPVEASELEDERPDVAVEAQRHGAALAAGTHQPPRKGSKLRVGLVWAGNPGYRFDRRRSIPPALLAPLGEVGGVDLVSLQQGFSGALPRKMEAFVPGSLADTAAVIARLDLVVSVDTALAHLAAAMGKPVWLLNRFGGDWRWSPATRAAWYPQVRVFDQTAPLLPAQAWVAPIEDMCAALRALILGR